MTIFLSLLFILAFFHCIILNANHVLFSTFGDGLKNYYTFLYHIQHDHDYLHFGGLNYPYGEHVLYTDNQPVFSNLLKWISEHCIDLSSQSVAILNLFLLLTPTVTSLIIFLILKRLPLPLGYAVPAAVGISFLSPQIIRLGGHYSLAYSFTIPLVWYLLIRFFETNRFIFTVILVLNALLWTGFHLYYLAIFTMFVSLFWLNWFLTERSRIPVRHAFLHSCLQIGFPLLVSILWLVGTDPMLADRKAQVTYGLYRASLAAVFLPSTPTFKLDLDFLVKWGDLESEGTAYVGLVGVVVLIYFAVRIFRSVWRGRYRQLLRLPGTPLLKGSLLVGVFSLLYSMGYPFRLGLEGIPDLLDPLKQFRSIGRFAWIFFYTYTLFSFYFLFLVYRGLRMNGRPLLGKIILISAMVVLYVEVGIQNHTLSSWINNTPPEFEGGGYSLPTTEWIEQIEIDRYQAIVPLPYYHIGSDIYFDYQGTQSSIFNSLIASLRTGLPRTSVFLARTAKQDAEKSIGFFGSQDERMKIVADFPNQKPFLILATHEKLSREEESLLRKASPVYRNEAVRVFELPFRQLTE